MICDLLSLVKEDEIFAFVARDPHLKNVLIEKYPALSDIETIKRPIESPYSFPRWFFDKALSRQIEKIKDFYIKWRVIRRAVRYGKRNGVECVWAVLQGKTMIISALKVAKALGVPLISQIWDEPKWILSDTGIDQKTKVKILKIFGETVKASKVCATASEPMAKKYQDKYRTKTVVFMGSLDAKMALSAAKRINYGNNLKIGFAGQLYATSEWKALILALDEVDWKIRGRRVTIHLLGGFGSSEMQNLPSNRVVNLGYKSQQQTIKILSKMDILYCPYWFDEEHRGIAKTSFPSKLTTYFAAGRPVFFHGPEYSSPAKFIRENKCGVLCHSLRSKDIVKQFEELLSDRKRYSQITRAGRVAFDKYLTYGNLSNQLTVFLNIAKESISR